MRATRPSSSSSVSASLLNRKVSSPASSVRIGTSLHGLQNTYQVCRGSWLSTHFMSSQMPSRSSNCYGALQKRKGRPLVKRSHGSLQPASSWK
jgi:hypothetical protein